MATVFVLTAGEMILSVNETKEGAMIAARNFINQSGGSIVDTKEKPVTDGVWIHINWTWYSDVWKERKYDIMMIRQKSVGN